jgi:hypothetical protein
VEINSLATNRTPRKNVLDEDAVQQHPGMIKGGAMVPVRVVLALVVLLSYSLGNACTKPTNIPLC